MAAQAAVPAIVAAATAPVVIPAGVIVAGMAVGAVGLAAFFAMASGYDIEINKDGIHMNSPKSKVISV